LEKVLDFPQRALYVRLEHGEKEMSIEQLKEEALRLSPEARAYLARELLASLDSMSEADIENRWIDEAIHRDDDLDQGLAEARPVDAVLARMRAHRA